jgi:hypothetical protein
MSTRPEGAEWAALLARADTGDGAALAEVKAAFDKAPETWRRIGSGFRRAMEGMVLNTTEGPVRQEAARRDLDDLAEDLAGKDAPPLERALAARCALALYELDCLTEMAAMAGAAAGLRHLDLIEALDRRRQRAHARAMSATRTLALVRRLNSGRPAVAVGVHVNVANGHNPDPDVSGP